MNYQVTKQQVKEVKSGIVIEHNEPNRSQRRSSVSNRNKVRQDVVLKDEEGNYTGIKQIFHKKKSNLPRLYSGMSKIKNRLPNTKP